MNTLKKATSQLSFIITVAILIWLTCFSAMPVMASVNQDSWTAHPTFLVKPNVTTSSPAGYSPTQIKTAYNLPSSGGSGTIAIIGAYDCPTVLNDLATFSNTYQLPPPNFEKYMMSTSMSVDSGWALEISMDVQWAHAIAPNAKILLVEARTPTSSDLLAAINYARNRPDVVAVSMSWGGYEFYSETLSDTYFTSPYGAAFFASSGDNGAGVIWPACSQNVISVGGTTLRLNSNGTTASETAWSGSGGGLSQYAAAPGYQLTYGVTNANNKRAVPDVSYNADPASGVSVYDSTPYQGQVGWFVLGGTSAGAPQWAAIQSLGLSCSNNNLYAAAKSNYASNFRDVTSGSNGLYSAKLGYDFVTGLGSPITQKFTNNGPTPPPPTSDYAISISPSSLTVAAGNSASATLIVTSLSSFSGTINLKATMPASWTATFSPPSVTVSAGYSATSAITFSVPSTATAGTYALTVTGTSGTLSHAAFATATVQTTGNIETIFLALVNAERANLGKNPINANSNLETAAYLHSKDMGDKNYFSHTSLDGTTFDQRIVASGYTNYYALGENIAFAYGPPSATQVFTMWKNSAGHYANMMGDYNDEGLGVYTLNGYTYYTLDLGKSRSTPSPTPDFALAALPTALTINAGTYAAATIAISSLNSFSGQVTLKTMVPYGWTATPNPASPTVSSGSSSSSTLTVSVPASASAGEYAISITGTSGTQSHTATVTVTVPVPQTQTPPSAPQNLKATAGNAQVILAWTAPNLAGSSAITSYRIYRATSSGKETLLATTGNALTYKDNAVVNNQTYYYKITAINAAGESATSNEANATPTTPSPSSQALSVTVQTDKTTYEKGATGIVTVTVKDSSTNNPKSGVSTTITIKRPDGSSISYLSYTGSTGIVRIAFFLSSTAQSGTYTVAISASNGAQTGNGQTAFTVT